jgi:hypothetical protein
MNDGNAIWRVMARQGQHFTDPDGLWAGAVRYFNWAESNPLYEHKPFVYQGEMKLELVPRARAMSVVGLRMFLGISRTVWAEYCMSEGFAEIAAQIEDVIRTQKLEGAAADLFNASIVQRDLGLRDKKEQIESPQMIADEDLDAKIAEFLAKNGIGQPVGGKGSPPG